MDEPDLFSIGEHCQESSCRQKDFLPFKCDCCQRVYCLEHRTYIAHACINAKGQQETTIICPLCARLVKVAAGQDPNAVFETHTRTDCEPSNYARVNKKPKCPVPGCKEKLSVVNSYVCKYCNASVCLKHRFAEDHACQQKGRLGSRHRESSRPLLSQLLGIGSSLASQTSSHSHNEKKASLTKTAAQPINSNLKNNTGPQSMVRAQAGNPGWEQAQRRSLSQRLQGPETCPTCQKSFVDVSELILHSKEHAIEPVQQEVCPHCRALFPNAVLLVEHVERQHTDNKGCVVC